MEMDDGPSIHGWRLPWMARAFGGKTQLQDVWQDTMEVPAIHGNCFRPWMEDMQQMQRNVVDF